MVEPDCGSETLYGVIVFPWRHQIASVDLAAPGSSERRRRRRGAGRCRGNGLAPAARPSSRLLGRQTGSAGSQPIWCAFDTRALRGVVHRICVDWLSGPAIKDVLTGVISKHGRGSDFPEWVQGTKRRRGWGLLMGTGFFGRILLTVSEVTFFLSLIQPPFTFLIGLWVGQKLSLSLDFLKLFFKERTSGSRCGVSHLNLN